MSRRKRYSPAGPTANAAIRRADKAMREGAHLTKVKPRRLLDEFPEIFNGLMPHEIKAVAFDALGRAGNNPWAITNEHLKQALDARGRR